MKVCAKLHLNPFNKYGDTTPREIGVEGQRTDRPKSQCSTPTRPTVGEKHKNCTLSVEGISYTAKQWRHWKGGGVPPRVTPSRGVTPEGKKFVGKFTKNSGETRSDR